MAEHLQKAYVQVLRLNACASAHAFTACAEESPKGTAMRQPGQTGTADSVAVLQHRVGAGALGAMSATWWWHA